MEPSVRAKVLECTYMYTHHSDKKDKKQLPVQKFTRESFKYAANQIKKHTTMQASSH